MTLNLFMDLRNLLTIRNGLFNPKMAIGNPPAALRLEILMKERNPPISGKVEQGVPVKLRDQEASQHHTEASS
jgi:hypothetical protein